ncbi:MAG: polysaccharide pyruvyl transferase family protein [Oscillospiraceae bacterium]|nr:polysaccharide pyruvyl transferase family protein [Oscillospiraceae bacterium]
MKIMLHGAINGTNFGDCLFAGMFYDSLTKAFGEDSVVFFDMKPFGIGNHIRKGLQYRTKLKLSDYQHVDHLVYISGGYFGDSNKSLKGSMIRYIRYLMVGLYAIKRKKNVYVIGLEVGPIHHTFVKKAIRRILSKANIVIVRNEDSLEYVRSMGLDHAICTADTAISITQEDFAGKESDSTVQLLDGINKKIIFLHLLPYDTIDDVFLRNIINPLIRFIRLHDEYCVVYGTDGGKRINDFEKLDQIFLEHNITALEHRYTDWYDMCYFLNKVDVILTRKLHVGIIGSKFNKSVISTPMHLYKTLRFYKQIGEEGRCVQYTKLSDETVFDLLNQYADKKIRIPNEVVSLSNQNLSMLIADLKKREEKK